MASYREKDMYGVRKLELFENRMVITGRNPGSSDHNLVVPFDHLEPTVNIVGSRGQGQWIGLLFLVAGVSLMFEWSEHSPFWTNGGFWVGLVFALVGLYVFLRSFRRIEMSVFYSTAGIAVLGIRRTGPDVARYQEFTEKVKNQIATHRSRVG
jgi:hypothetical protein